ncbi:MAG: hypothetical protein A2Y55_06580 [Actinobacteria bacterium RBG_16_68_12]|nr:MAG: hypothetical protein A2Y55_06580 [Actinobacteria bacterium RBG_16_68_12]
MERIGREVERTLSRSGGGEALALGEITAAWPEAVGDAVARQAWPLRLGRDGTLHVATSSATWAFELDRLSPEIAERLAAVLGSPAPAKLRFRVGPVPEPGPEPGAASQESSTSLPASPEAEAEAASAAAAIEDPELRELVARAARASLSRARSGCRFW